MSDDFSERIRKMGETPWTLEGLGAAFVHAAGLHHTPRDDWDRARRGIRLQGEEGQHVELTFNPDMMQNQLGLWLSRTMREQGLDFATRQCHMWRLFEVLEFLKDNEHRLVAAGLIRLVNHDPDQRDISGSLMTVLATAPYEGVRLQGVDPIPSFHYDKVVAEANALREVDPD